MNYSRYFRLTDAPQQSSIGETPYNLMYGTDVMLPIDVREVTLHR